MKEDKIFLKVFIAYCFAIITSFLLVAFFIPTKCVAQYAGDNPRKEIFLRVVHIDSNTSMHVDKAYQIYQDITKYYSKNTEIELLPSGFISLADPRSNYINVSNDLEVRSRSKKLWFYLTKNKLSHKPKEREIILIIDRSLNYNGFFNYSGGSSDVCSLYCASCFSYTHGNSELSAFKIAIHEVGHALGVKGHEDNTIMDFSIPNYILGDYAKKRIAGCNRKTTKRKVFECRRKKFRNRCLRRWRLR